MTPAICDFGLPRKCMWLGDHGGFPCSSAVQNPPATQKIWETQVGFLVWEDYLEKGMTTDSSILAWRIPWTEEPGGLQFIGSQRLRHDWSDSMHTHARTHTHAHTHTHTQRRDHGRDWYFSRYRSTTPTPPKMTFPGDETSFAETCM